MENMKISSCIKQQGIEPAALSSKLLPILLKMNISGGHMFYKGLYRENMKNIFLYETTIPRALIFSIKHHLVDP